MALLFDAVCTDREACPQDRREQVVRAIGEILPFVIAKYGARRESGRLADGETRRASQRFLLR